jgi:hypothetical protein
MADSFETRESRDRPQPISKIRSAFLSSRAGQWTVRTTLTWLVSSERDEDRADEDQTEIYAGMARRGGSYGTMNKWEIAERVQYDTFKRRLA